MAQTLDRLRSLMLGRRTAWLFVLIPLLLAGAVIGGLGEGERSATPTDALPAGADSTRAVQLAQNLPSQDDATAVVLFTGERSTLTAQRAQLQTVLRDLGAQSPLVPAQDGTAAIGVLSLQGGSATAVADQVERLRSTLQARAPDGVRAQVTGPAGIRADLAAVFDGADTRLLMITALVVALLLILTYRSPILWVVPLTVVATADRLAAVLATRVLAGLDVAWDESTVGILSVLVFGAGTNYALLLVSRYRDELRRHADRRVAMNIAVRHTAHAVSTSALTVVVGVLTLLLSAIPTTRGLGLACAVGIVVAAGFVLLVLPAALVSLGRWVFWPRVPHLNPAGAADADTDPAEHSLWRRIGDRVARHPGRWVAGTVTLLAAMSFGLTQISTGLDTAEQFLDRPEAIVAADRIAESFPAGVAEPTTVVTTDDAGQVQRALEQVPQVTQVRRGPSSEDGRTTRFDLTIDAKSGTPQADTAIERVRGAVAGLPDTHVGGSTAEGLDETAANARDRLVIFPLIVLVVFGALALLLRSVLGPLILVATVCATFAAALGVSWWIFTGPLGFANLAGNVPLFAFLFLVALGIDYNIFLITRTIEETRTHGTRAGVLRALGATGGVITSAGILLASVFAVLGVLPLVVLAQLGLVIFIGVLLDTLVVRTVLVPALVRLLGDTFWWPRRVPSPAADVTTEAASDQPRGV